MDEVPVGGKQVVWAMQHARHGHMCRDKVVEPAQGARDLVFGRLGRFGLEAEHGADAFLALVRREVAPVELSVPLPPMYSDV